MGLLSSQAWAGSTPSTDTDNTLRRDHQPSESNDIRTISTSLDLHPKSRASYQSFHQATTRPISAPSQPQHRILDNEKPPVLPVPIEDPASSRQADSSRSTLRNGNGSPKSARSSINEKAIEVVEPSMTNRHPSNGSEEKQAELERTVSTATASTEGGAPGEDDESKYPKSYALASLTFGLVMATFMIALDNTIIATAIPKITTVFNSLDDVGWYGSAYLLTTTSLQPSFGKVYTYFNIKWTYMIALVIFELGSVLCGAAQSSTMLIVGRAVAGVGAAAMFSGAMIIIGYSVPLRKRSIYIASLSSVFGISAIVGPILGGAFTDRVSWRWCFFINLPIGGVALVVVFFVFHNPQRRHSKLTTRQKIAQIDLLGALFLIGSVVCLLLALQWGGTKYPWSSSKVYGPIIGFGLLISTFTGLRFYLGDRATFPPRIILHQRTVFACCFFSAFLAMGLYTHIYYLPFYFQAVKGTTAEQSGIRTIPYLVANTLASIVVGGSITALGPYVPFTWVGSAIFAVGSGLLYTLTPTSSAGQWIGYQILAGAGAGTCVQIPFIAVQVVLPKKDMPTGNAVAIFFNTLGGALSISIAQNVFSNTLVKQIPVYAPTVNPAVVVAAGATHVRDVVTKAQLPGVLLAYNKAVTSSFVLAIATSGLAFCLSFLFEWKSVKGKKLEIGGGA